MHEVVEREWLTYKEAAARTGYTVRQLERLVMDRRIPFTKLGRNTRFDPEKLDRHVAANTFDPEDET